MNYFIWGLGEVGFSFLKKIKDEGLFDPSLFYCVEPNIDRKESFIIEGGLEDHFYNDTITRDNYLSYLSKLNEGDCLLDFATNIKNLEILEYCLKHNIHYLFTADSSWNPDPDWVSNHQHYLKYIKLKDKYKNYKSTSIVSFGMNPGLVSIFAKQCLIDIVALDDSSYVSRNRNKLKKLLSENQFNKVAKLLKVTHIQEIDNDDQIPSIEFEKNIIYSTWNPSAFFWETVSAPELALGTKKEYLSYQRIYDCDINDLYIGIYIGAFDCPEETFSPQGFVTGHITTHEEIYTIRRYFTYGRYKPSVYFVYSPCDYSMRSIETNEDINLLKDHLINKKEIISGGESVGIIIQGKRFKTRYYGNYLKTNDLDESATIIQVSAGAFSAFKYMMNHPNEGMLFPEELDEKEVLGYAEKYLKSYISIECPTIKMNMGHLKDKSISK